MDLTIKLKPLRSLRTSVEKKQKKSQEQKKTDWFSSKCRAIWEEFLPTLWTLIVAPVFVIT